jgi:hypothetical protein
MKIMVAGGTGFIGKNLIDSLLNFNHSVTVLGRNIYKIKAIFGDKVTALSWQDLNNTSPSDFDIAINLTGENLGQRRWSQSVKATLKLSRVKATQQIARWCSQSTSKKIHLYNASAIGVYGLQPIKDNSAPPVTESTIIDVSDKDDFLAEIGREWEQAAMAAADSDIPLTLMRFGVVLKRNGGVLKKLAPSYAYGLGSVLGSGNQPFTWVHIDDLVAAIIFLINHPHITGPVNICAPQCVTQKQFAKELAQAMNKPLLLTLPAIIIKLLFGQMGEQLLLRGQNVYPQRLTELGYRFSYPTLQAALAHEWPR